jgi:hypothetical protein
VSRLAAGGETITGPATTFGAAPCVGIAVGSLLTGLDEAGARSVVTLDTAPADGFTVG